MSLSKEHTTALWNAVQDSKLLVLGVSVLNLSHCHLLPIKWPTKPPLCRCSATRAKSRYHLGIVASILYDVLSLSGVQVCHTVMQADPMFAEYRIALEPKSTLPPPPL